MRKEWPFGLWSCDGFAAIADLTVYYSNMCDLQTCTLVKPKKHVCEIMIRSHNSSFNSACQIPTKPLVSWLYSCPGK